MRMRQAQDLEAQAGKLEKALAAVRRGLGAIEEKLRERQAILEELQALQKAGVNPEQLSRWSAVLSRAGAGPEELGSDVERYGSLLAACRELEVRERKLQAAVRALEGSWGAGRAAAALKESAASAIAALKRRRLAEVEPRRGRWGRG